MFRALLRKDARLLRVYLRISIATTLLLYPAGFGIVCWFTGYYLDEARQTLAARSLVTLAGASNTGLILTYLFAAIIAGSTFALERSDRSSEFLACLPPTRWQNLWSKIVILFAAIGGMILLHNLAAWCGWQLLPYARSIEFQFSFIANLSITSGILCIAGFSFAGSSLMKSNGGPALLGLFSPLLSLAIVSSLGRLLDIPSEGNAFAMRYAMTCLALGCTTFLCGCFWYLNRSEP